MNTDVIVAALGSAISIGVPVGAGLIAMYGKLVKVETQLNGHLKSHENIDARIEDTYKLVTQLECLPRGENHDPTER